jgi:predicted aspartyl protease
MRIYGGRGRGNLGHVNAFLMCPNPEISKPIRFYVDTGASRTTIADRDAIRLGLDYTQLQQSDPALGIQ